MNLSLSTSQKSPLFAISFSLLAAISIGLAVLTFLPSTQDFIRNLILSNSRLVLAKVDADLTGQGQKISIIKVKSSETLSLEIFETDGHGDSLKFVKRIVLPEKQDAFFNFRGTPSNLVIADIDGDEILEVIAPTFDDNLVPRLNVFKFNPENRELTKVNSEDISL